MRSGDRILWFNGVTEKPVADFTMPEAGRSPKSRLRAAAKFIKTIQKFLTASEEEGALVKLPQFATIYPQVVRGKNTRLLVIGSPVYYDEQPANDMRRGWLGDGYLNQPPSVSLFSVQKKAENLGGACVHWCILDDDIWNEEHKTAHREGVQRFWALYIQHTGDTLASFQPSIKIAFKRFGENECDPVGEYQLDEQQQELIIHQTSIEQAAAPRVQKQVASVKVLDLSAPEHKWITEEKVAAEQPEAAAASEEPSAPVEPEPEPLPEIAPMQVALTWPGENIDLDLYATGAPGGEELFFNHTRTEEGTHYKDFTNPKPLYGFELLDFTSAVRPENVTLWVNVHSGKSEDGFPGEVRIKYGGRVFAYPFTIPATEGNRGADRATRENSEYWKSIPVLEILNS